MAPFTDREVEKWVRQFTAKVREKYKPERIILFGSRARQEHLLESDIDVVIVSSKFENVVWGRRISDVAELWDGFITLEPLCYTPQEFEEKKHQIGIVQQAVKEGVEI